MFLVHHLYIILVLSLLQHFKFIQSQFYVLILLVVCFFFGLLDFPAYSALICFSLTLIVASSSSLLLIALSYLLTLLFGFAVLSVIFSLFDAEVGEK